MVKFYPVEEYQANMFLKRVLENPKAFDEVESLQFLLKTFMETSRTGNQEVRSVSCLIRLNFTQRHCFRTAGAMVLHLSEYI